MNKRITVTLTRGQFNYIFNVLNDPEAVSATPFVKRLIRKLLDAHKEQIS